MGKTYRGKITIPNTDIIEVNAELTMEFNKAIQIKAWYRPKGLVHESYTFIFGSFENFGEVTFVNAINIATHYHAVHIAEYWVELMISGIQTNKLEEINFPALALRFESLHKWIGQSSLQWNPVERKLTLAQEYEKHFFIEDMLKAILRIKRDEPILVTDSICISEYAEICFEVQDKTLGMTLDTALEYTERIEKFFTLLTGQTQPAVYLYDLTNNLQIFRRGSEIESGNKVNSLTFSYQEVEPFLEVLLQGVFQSDEIKHFLNGMLTQVINRDASLNTHFLNAVASFEGLSKIIDEKASLRDALDRSKEMLSAFYTDNQNFKELVCNTRNFLAHGKRREGQEIFSEIHLIYATRCLVLVTFGNLLMLLGMDIEFVKSKVASESKTFKGIKDSNLSRRIGLVKLRL